VTYVNRAACGFFGFERDLIVGRKLGEGLRGFDLETLAKSRSSVSRDLEVFYPENRYLNFYVTAIDEHEDLGFVMLIRDITQTRKLTEEKIENERVSALTLLAAGVAHELGNPLNSLTIHLQLMERRLKKLDAKHSARLLDMLGVAQGEIKRLDLIIGQFLTAIRPTQPQLQRVRINDLIEESVKFLDPDLTQARVTVKLDLGTAVPAMPLDANQMKQAFYNLIRNACQAMSEGGTLAIASIATDFEVRLTFADSGRGISTTNMSNLFQPFFTTRKTGTGLGLLIVRRIIREHGGEIELESREGEGTKVTIYLPLVEKKMRLLQAPAPEATDAARRNGGAAKT
jgi:signal transduction histidine kinase